MAEANFSVSLTSDGGKTPVVYPRGTSYKIEPNGVLKITWPDGRREHIAPHAWLSVSEKRHDQAGSGRVVTSM